MFLKDKSKWTKSSVVVCRDNNVAFKGQRLRLSQRQCSDKLTTGFYACIVMHQSSLHFFILHIIVRILEMNGFIIEL